jgi:hypothetical protein
MSDFMREAQAFNLDWNKLNLSKSEKDALALCELAYIVRHITRSDIDDDLIDYCMSFAETLAVSDKVKDRFKRFCCCWIDKKAKKSIRKRLAKALEANVSIKEIPVNTDNTPNLNSKKQRLKNRTPRERFIAKFRQELGDEPMPGFTSRRADIYLNKIRRASNEGLINDNDHGRLVSAVYNKCARNNGVAARRSAESYHRIMTLIEHGYLPCFPGHENEFEHVKDEKKSVTKEWRRYQRDKRKGLVD